MISRDLLPTAPPRAQVINRAGEKISPLAVEHALLAACVAAEEGGGGADGGVGKPKGELHGWVREVLAFGAPHAELGEAVGVAIVCEPGRTATLVQLRRAASKGGLLSRRWLPELLLVLPSLPRGPTGKPARIGLAEAFKLPLLSVAAGLQTIDMRGKQPLAHEAARRAEARKAAAKRSTARKQEAAPEAGTAVGGGGGRGDGGGGGGGRGVAGEGPRGDGVATGGSDAAVASTSSLNGCVRLVLLSMLEASGEAVGEDDDLFDAGLSSISAARLREELDERTGLTLPLNLVYDNTGVRALAAAILLLARGSSAAGADGASGEDEPSLLLPTASEAYREGRLPQAETLCLRAAAFLGIAPGSVPPPEAAAAEGEGGSEAAAAEGQARGRLQTSAPPLLVLLIGVWSRQAKWAEATAACRWLLHLRGRPDGGVDAALVAMQMARFAAASADSTAAAAAISLAEGALNAAAAHRIAPAAAKAAVTAAGEEAAFEDADGHADDGLGAAAAADASVHGANHGTQLGAQLGAQHGEIDSREHWCSSCADDLRTLDVSSCAQIRTLDVRKQGLAHLPEAVGELRALRVLDASNNDLASLPASMAGLAELSELLLTSNAFEDLPGWIASLPQLHVLSLQDNRFPRLPAVALRCAKLKHLRWGLQRPTEAAAEATARRVESSRSAGDASNGGDGGGMGSSGGGGSDEFCAHGAEYSSHGFTSPHLTVLELEANAQAALPPLHAHGTRLTALLASFNRLHTPPAQLVRYGGSLRRLQLGSNAIVSVAEVLPALTNLTTLCLEANRLVELPPSIGALLQLRELWLFGNELCTLPAELGQCASLTKLEAHHNRLAQLPDSLSRLTKLKSLYLQASPALLALPWPPLFSPSLGLPSSHPRLASPLLTFAWPPLFSLQANELCDLCSLRDRVLRHLPLLNLALGANRFDLAEAFELPGVRMGLGWNHGVVPTPLRGVLTDRFATADHLFEPACRGHRAPILLVAFAAQGPGMQQWAVPAAAARAAGAQLDALYVADPSNSYYLQDPSGGWRGVEYYARLLAEHADGYAKVLLVGSSMGATAVLQHAQRADRVLAFGPRLDLRLTHGSFVAERAKGSCASAISAALDETRGSVAVHVGGGNLEDMTQARALRGRRGVVVVEHDTFHHNIPMFLEREQALVPLLKRELVEMMRPTP